MCMHLFVLVCVCLCVSVCVREIRHLYMHVCIIRNLCTCDTDVCKYLCVSYVCTYVPVWRVMYVIQTHYCV